MHLCQIMADYHIAGVFAREVRVDHAAKAQPERDGALIGRIDVIHQPGESQNVVFSAATLVGLEFNVCPYQFPVNPRMNKVTFC